MPARNTEKIYTEDTYYHIYNRGAGKQAIFKDQKDYVVFLNLLKRLLGDEILEDRQGREYPNFHKDIRLLAYCLMPNHFHLFVYQLDKKAITNLLRSLCTAYTMYFNRKYKRAGHLFQGRFKASAIDDDAYLLHVSRYIHLNPERYLEWEFSSLPYYLSNKRASWIKPEQILEMFAGDNYSFFLKDYLSHQSILKDLKHQLADT